MVTDITGREYNIGDYVFCATVQRSGIDTYIGKVCNVGENTIAVVQYHKCSWRDSNFFKSTIMKPERDVIIPAEVALIKSPELVDYDVSPKEYEHFDVLGTKYNVGDYIFVAQHYSNSSVRTYFAKVVKILPESLKIKKVSNWRNRVVETVLRVPERHMIVPEEIALKGEPMLNKE